MAIEKNSFKVSRFDSEISPQSGETMSSDEELQRPSETVESEDDEFDDCDSGAGSDDFDLLELGETGEEFCQVGDQTCTIPFELYDLPGLGDVLSMDVWNDCLTEEDRFNLTKYLPDMDQETFMRTLKELFTGRDLHFGSPIDKLYGMLKGGLCEPRVALYRQGLNFFQKRKHYHLLQKHQNSMVTSIYQIRDAWVNCRGYSIEEKLRVLNIMKSQKSLMYEKMEELETDPSEGEESGEGMWNKKMKDRKIGQKIGRQHSIYRASPTIDFPSRGKSMALEPTKYGKQNPKGTLKLSGSKTSSAKEYTSRLSALQHGMEMKSGLYGSALGPPRVNKASGYDSGMMMRGDDDAEEEMYEVAVHRDRNLSRVSAMDKSGAFKIGKKHESLRGDKYNTDGFMGSPISSKNDFYAYGKKKTVNQLSDIEVLTAKPSNTRMTYGYGKKAKYPENVQQYAAEDQMKYVKGQSNLSLKGSQIERSDGAEAFDYSNWNVKNKKWKMGRESPDFKVKDGLFLSDYGAKPSQKSIRTFSKSEETESDSSEEIDEDEDNNPLIRSKFAYPPPSVKTGPQPNKAKFAKKDKKGSSQTFNGLSHSRKMADLGEPVLFQENYPLKAKQKGKMHDSGHLQSSGSRVLEDSYFSGSVRFGDDDHDRKPIFKSGKNGLLQEEHGKKFRIPSLKAHPVERRQKGEVGRDNSNYLHDFIVDEDGDSLETRHFVEESGVNSGLVRRRSHVTEEHATDRYEKSATPLLGSVAKKRKVKEDVPCLADQDNNDFPSSNPHQQLDEITSSKKRGKRKLEDHTGTFDTVASEPPVTETGAADLELETKSQKKPFTLITPTVHTGFSFSIVHLLSAVRMAMITLLPDDSLEVGKHRKEEGSNGVHLDINNSDLSGQTNVPSLTVQEIVNRVRSNPGDPCILETQEPLQDLVRGVLKIFSSKTAPLGAKAWKALVFYEKSTKTWSWVGPVSHSSSDHEAIEEVTSPESWGVPHKMLVKLVDSFANWLKSGQETLKQIGSLPAPPLTLLQFNLDEKERFRDLRAQKSLITISPSSEEVRAYFRIEEVLRYSIPDRAFSYTAVDGKKSIVAPLRRCGGKPTSKARDHFMLKRDRPPHVTILCLVRDAAARLPGSIGTRADVCTLIRDSQYVVEDVSDVQVNQVVSGALDRLHYERDPCVQFDGERKLWVYLHREREEEDFEDDGTSSTKKWKRQKKEAAEPFDHGTVTVAYPGAEEQTGFELSSDHNVDPSCMDEDKRPDLVYYDGMRNVEDSVDVSHGSEQNAMHRGRPIAWGPLDLNPMQENRLMCQENSTNEDFDDETFGREPRAEILSTSLS